MNSNDLKTVLLKELRAYDELHQLNIPDLLEYLPARVLAGFYTIHTEDKTLKYFDEMIRELEKDKYIEWDSEKNIRITASGKLQVP